MPFKILVAEDEEITLRNILEALKEEGFEAHSAVDGAQAYNKMENERFDILIADIKMPKLSGMELLERTKKQRPETDVIIITGFGSISSAVEAMKKGAVDYLTKPFDLDELTLKVKKIHEQKILRKDNIALRTFLGMKKDISIIARSTSMKRILDTIEDMKGADVNVFLTGETGVGKNLIAKIIHFTSMRQDRPCLSINCATLSEELLVSELFGHEKGAFTGATAAKQGLVEIADTGTLFLDEISELSPSLQAKLLKAIEDGEFFRVGGTKPIRVDVRFIAATNRNVKDIISEGKFREDLYYRLNIMEIFISPLRKRREDIRPLSAYFLQKHIPKSNKKITGFSKEAMEIIMKYSFPGNVRELENIIERAIILEKGAMITLESLPTDLRTLQIETLEPSRIMTVDEKVREYAEKVINILGGNKTKAAEMLGISRTSLWKILKED
jgi:DNA-binding NtrC family response regulator